MNQQPVHNPAVERREEMARAALARSVPFPEDPRLPVDEVQAIVNTWHRRQLAMLRMALGEESWPVVQPWIKSLLREEVRTRLAAMGWRLKP